VKKNSESPRKGRCRDYRTNVPSKRLKKHQKGRGTGRWGLLKKEGEGSEGDNPRHSGTSVAKDFKAAG